MNKKLRILQVTPYYFPSIGGVAGVVQYLSEELVRRGHEVIVYTTNTDHPGRPELIVNKIDNINGVLVQRFNSIIKLKHIRFCPLQIPKYFIENYDLVHNHGYRHPQADVLSYICKLRSIPMVMQGHGPFFKKNSISALRANLYRIYDKIARHGIFKRLDKIVVLSKFEKENFLKIGADASRIEIIPNAASNDCFLSVNPDAVKQEYSITGKQILLFMGVLNEFKRPDLVIRAMPKILQQIPNAFLLYAGPDAGMVDKINKISHELGVENNFKWIGPVTGVKKQQVLEAADIFFLPSDEDPFPLAVFEAMAHRKPVIVSDADGLKEQVVNGETGFILKKGDYNQLADVAINLLKQPLLCRNIGEKARQVVEKKYSVSRVVDQFESMYYELIGGKGGDKK